MESLTREVNFDGINLNFRGISLGQIDDEFICCSEPIPQDYMNKKKLQLLEQNTGVNFK